MFAYITIYYDQFRFYFLEVACHIFGRTGHTPQIKMLPVEHSDSPTLVKRFPCQAAPWAPEVCLGRGSQALVLLETVGEAVGSRGGG